MTCTVLLMGETGCGKSTLINSLVNMFAKSEMKDRASIKVAIKTKFLQQSPEFSNLAGSEAGGSGVESMTRACTTYPLRGQIGRTDCKLNVIDSPGITDTRGVHQDKKNFEVDGRMDGQGIHWGWNPCLCALDVWINGY